MSSFDRTVSRRRDQRAALALGLTLSACGRRGPLEAPPGRGRARRRGRCEIDAEGRPIAPPGEKKRLPIDVLLD